MYFDKLSFEISFSKTNSLLTAVVVKQPNYLGHAKKISWFSDNWSKKYG